MISVSVITTFYNSSKYILESIDSVLKQEVDDHICVDYILVDDCSTDNTLDIVHEYIKEKKEINKLHHIDIRIIQTSQNLGCGGARKFGIDNSIGDYLMFLDADDYYINSDFINRAVHNIMNEDADIVEYGVMYNTPSQNIDCHISDKLIFDDMNKALIALFSENVIRFHIWTKIIKRLIALSYPYSEARTYEDVDTIPIWVSLCHRIVIMPSSEIVYRFVEDSIIHNNDDEMRIGTIKSLYNHFERFKDHLGILISIYKRANIDFNKILNDETKKGTKVYNELTKYNDLMVSYIEKLLYFNYKIKI